MSIFNLEQQIFPKLQCHSFTITNFQSLAILLFFYLEYDIFVSLSKILFIDTSQEDSLKKCTDKWKYNMLTIFKNYQISISHNKLMYSEMNSVRSDSLININSRGFNINRPSIYYGSEYVSESRLQGGTQKWKNMLLPEIDVKYQEIMNERQGITRKVDIDTEKSRVSIVSRGSKLVMPRLSNSGLLDAKSMQMLYEQKIQTLEQQNDNLRQELYYLREALLINFETKQKIKQKQEKSPPKNKQ